MVSRHPERFSVLGLSAMQRIDELIAQCRRWQPRWAVVPDETRARVVRDALREQGVATEVLSGAQALCDMAADPEVDSVMAAIVGAAGLAPCLAAARAGKRLLLANKEALVVGGALFMRAVKEGGATLLPIDSEHSAIFQCLPQRAQPVAADASTTSCSPPRAGRFAPATRPRCTASRPMRPAPIRTG